MAWMREIIENENLDIGFPEVETIGKDRKMPDLALFESRRSNRVLLVLEAKLPIYDVYDEDELKEPARRKAANRRSKYFACLNFKKLVWYNTEKANQMRPEEEQIVEKYDLCDIYNLDELEYTRHAAQIKKQLTLFLRKLQAIHTGKEPEPRHAIDDLLIGRIHEKIRVLSIHYQHSIEDQYRSDKEFKNKLRRWFIDQGWEFSGQAHDFEKIAHQTAYLLVNKILFYCILQTQRPADLNPMELTEETWKKSLVESLLRTYFSDVQKIDYQTVFTSEFIDEIAFPEDIEVFREISALIRIFKRYDLSKLGFDVIGRIFERIIPDRERHILGQYFTGPDVVDLILQFCVKHENDNVLDPSCGAGTFLVRAYRHKQLMNQNKTHEEIIRTLWGIDIAKFPAHLATINLAINDLSVDRNFPNIVQENFFAVKATDKGVKLPKNWIKTRAVAIGEVEKNIDYPDRFDAIVGNPPYTRQEEIPDTGVNKRRLIENSIYDFDGKPLANLTKRSSIHAYFFVHGTKMLKDGGYFGFIVSNSWLDVDYGRGLQEFLLKNYKIIAIIESKVERWFEAADINTCILILQKCNENNHRMDNPVRFVLMKKNLRSLIPPPTEKWEKQIERKNKIDNFIRTILSHSTQYENDDMKISPISQRELWERGFSHDENEYLGSKWGKYIRGSQVVLKLLEKRNTFIKLKDIARVLRGFTTGANEFFYLSEPTIKRRRIGKEFWMEKNEQGEWEPNYLIKSPRECKRLVVDKETLEKRVLMIHKQRDKLYGRKIWRYIREAEEKGVHKRSTFQSRSKWYDLGQWEKPGLLWPDAYNDRYGVYDPNGAWADKRFFYINLNDIQMKPAVQAYLNSTLIPLFIEIEGITNLGEGAVYTNVYQLQSLPVPRNLMDFCGDLSEVLEALKKRQLSSIFVELGAQNQEDVGLSTVLPDRRRLDEIVMGEILGLTEVEQLDIYRNVIDLVGSRIARARSLGKKNKILNGINTTQFVKDVLKEIGKPTIGDLYREKILSRNDLKLRRIQTGRGDKTVENGLFGWSLNNGGVPVECSSETEAKYLKTLVECGMDEIQVPQDEKSLKKITEELIKIKSKIDEVVDYYLESIVNQKTKDKLDHLVWAGLIR